MVVTEGLQAAGINESEMGKQYEAQAPLHRLGQPKDIATAVVFLASPDADWITGETLYVAGGYR
jgi:3-oxoacyl-[acyl-carrier protein] reductase